MLRGLTADTHCVGVMVEPILNFLQNGLVFRGELARRPQKKSAPFAESRPRDPAIADLLPRAEWAASAHFGTIDLDTLRLMLIEHKFLE